MKLEVGQKIGIYEVLYDWCYKSTPKGSQMLVQGKSNDTICLFDDKDYDNPYSYNRHEVRLVASLRVKAVK